MKKRVFTIFLLLALLLTALTGCDSPAGAESTGSPGAENETEYTPEETDGSDMPGNGGENPSNEVEDPSDEPAPDYVELPSGCYAGFDNGYVFGYLEVTDSTMIFYYSTGEIETEARYSYDSDGSCLLEMDDAAVTVHFTYEQGIYYINNESGSRRLEPIGAIPSNNAPSGLRAG